MRARESQETARSVRLKATSAADPRACGL
jgi:hypothetical protein